MKWNYFAGLLLLLTVSCSTPREASNTSASLVHDSIDSAAYDVIVTDPEFDQWFTVHYTEAKDRPDQFYRSRNIIAVSNWNYYFLNGRYSLVIDSYIDYRPEVDYGIGVNRKLYWYFTYVTTKYKVPVFR